MPEFDFPKLTPALFDAYRQDPILFIESQAVVQNALDGGKTWIRPVLTPLQREVTTAVLMRKDENGDQFYTTALLSWARKMSKTILAGLWWNWKICCQRNELILISGPTKYAAEGLAFKTSVAIFDRNPALARAVGANPIQDTIEIKGTNSELRAVSSSFGAQAGADWSCSHVDELSFFCDKKMLDFYAIVTTPSLARINPLVCVTSYAPIEGKSTALEDLWRKAYLSPEDPDYDPRFYSNIVQGEPNIIATTPWITAEKLAQAKRSVQPHIYRRIYLNKPTREMDDKDRYAYSGKQIADVIDKTWSRQETRPCGPEPNKTLIGQIIAGIDFAGKHDAAVVAVVGKMADRTLALLDLIVAHGSKESPLNAGWAVVKLNDVARRFGRPKVMADPSLLTDQIVELRALGYEVVELNRRGPTIAQFLWGAISGRRIRFYPRAGEVRIFDGRDYALEDELHHLLFDQDTLKMSHFGEAHQKGRHYDDRCTAIGQALNAPELMLEHTTEMGAFDQANQLNARLGDGRGRIFDGKPIKPGATFAPRLLQRPAVGRFGFMRHKL